MVGKNVILCLIIFSSLLKTILLLTVSRSQPNIKKYCSPFSGNDVVLGPALSVTHERTLDGIPIEQAICKKKLRPGSGFLSVGITTDGPTRVLQISDSKNKASFQCYKASQGKI